MSYGSVDGLENAAQTAHNEDSLALLRASQIPNDNPSVECVECDEVIPLARRTAIPGVRHCVACKSVLERSGKPLFTFSNPYVP